jgi:outer membrane protein OmpA-like peptidoglycan-associated protein
MTNSGRRAAPSQSHIVRRSAITRRRRTEATAQVPLERPAAAIMRLQRGVGNRATSGLIQRIQTGQPLEPSWRARLQDAFGVDLADVRIHTDAAADAVQAIALTRGRDIHLGRKAPPAGTTAGRALLAHEVAHVVQQGQATSARSGAVGLPGDKFEQAADAAAHAVMAGRRVQPMPTDAAPAVQHQRGAAQPDLLRELLAEAERKGVAYDLDKGLLVGGVPVKEVPRGAELIRKLSRGDVQGAIEIFKPRDPGERERIRQETLTLQRELERLRPAEVREREQREEREQLVAEASRRLGQRPEPAGPGLRLPEPTLSPREVGLRFGTITSWVLDRFPVDGATLQPQHRVVLDDLAQQANAHPNSQIEIVGHADTTGPDAENLRLSQRRAEAVRAYLLGRRVDSGKITGVRGEGEGIPLVEEHTAEDRARNRRVEIRFWTGVQERR